MENKLEFAKDLLNFCFLPELQQDIDSLQIEKEHFSNYHKRLELQLPILYSFVQQNDWILTSNESEVEKVRASIVMLLCELCATEPTPVYKLLNEALIENANKLLERNVLLNPTIEQIILKEYQSKLHKNSWKRQMGTVHGFLHFLKWRYQSRDNRNSSQKMSTQWITFCLSVGLCVRECHEPIYKQIGTRIFQIMLDQSPPEDIQDLNVHSVIYNGMFKDVHYMDSEEITKDIWNCLCKCLDFYTNIDSLTWSYVDDMMEALLRDITLAPNSLISICLWKNVTKLCAYFAINRQEIENQLNADLIEPKELNKCRALCGTNSSYTAFRWAKNILNLIIVESYKLMQCPNSCQQFLQELHKCFMVFILPIPLPIIETHLSTFQEKFTAVLMEVLVIQNGNDHILELIQGVIETFYLHVQSSPHCIKNEKLVVLRDGFEKLLQHLTSTHSKLF